jgi:hypothetical protein
MRNSFEKPQSKMQKRSRDPNHRVSQLFGTMLVRISRCQWQASFHSRATAYWETLPHSDQVRHLNETVGPKNNLDAAGVYSVSLHKLHHPQYMARIQSFFSARVPLRTLLWAEALGACDL